MTSFNIYLVDPEEAVRKSIAYRFYKLLDIRAAHYATGESFLAQADLQSPGCVVTEVRLSMDGGMHGLEVLEHLVKIGSPLSVIFLTAYGSSEKPLAVQALEKGAFAWLEKPSTDSLLIETLKKCISMCEKTW